MSYILEALRRSERERQKNQAPLIGSTAVGQPSQKSRWPVWAVSGLLLLNVLILLLVFGFQSKTPDSENFAHSDQRPDMKKQLDEIPATKDGVANNNAGPANGRPKGSKIESSPSDPPTRLAQKEKQTSIALRKPPIKATEPRPTVIKPIRKRTTPRSTPGEIRQRINPPITSPIIKKETKTGKLADEALDPISKRIAANRTLNWPKTPPKKESKSVSQLEIAKEDEGEDVANDIPLLRDMPPDFQRRVPTLKVNVFAYSEIAEERFAIVNMVKYREGQAPQNGLIIEEIGPDSMVLRYEGKKFRYGN